MKIIFSLYTFFIILFVFFSYLFIDPNFFYLHSFYTDFFQTQRIVTTFIYTLAISVFYIFYLIYLFNVIHSNISGKQTVLLIGIGLLLLFSYAGMLSFDIYNYIATAKVTFFYHENPYIVMPIEFTKDPLLLFMHAANKTALYAPLWIFLTGIPFLLGLGNFLFTVFTFKLFVAIFYVLTIFLIWKMTKNLHKTLFFGLNPLVVIETLVSGHNDIVMMFLLLFSIYLFINNHYGKSFLLFIFSGAIKYVTLVLLPLFIFTKLRQWNTHKMFSAITIFMTIIFFLSAFREEIYPWYAIWFLLPGTFLIENKIIKYLLISFTFGLLLRYIPFMLLGTYFGPTPVLKIILMVIPTVIVMFWLAGRQIVRH